MKTKNSQELFEKSKNHIAGGVNSPVRAFKSVGGSPIFFKKSRGRRRDVGKVCYLYVLQSLLKVVIVGTNRSPQPRKRIFYVPLNDFTTFRGHTSHLHQLFSCLTVFRQLFSSLSYKDIKGYSIRFLLKV